MKSSSLIWRTALVFLFLNPVIVWCAPAHLTRRPGAVLYKLRANASPAQRAAAERILARMSQTAQSRSMHLSAAPALIGREDDLAEDLVETGAVEFAEPDNVARPEVIPNDPEFPAQWFHNTIRDPEAWALSTGDSRVVVAVCDSGVDRSHPDLAANVRSGYNVVDRNGNTEPVSFHGTAVAGLIGASANNRIGVTGVSWQVSILPIRITNEADGTAFCSDMVSGIEWAADHGANVINLSYDSRGCPRALDTAAQYARSKGVLTLIAAGNETQNLSLTGYPVNHSFLLIGATDRSDRLASFSNFGKPIDMVAPGAAVLTTVPGASYGYASGTSFATPIVAGAAALMYAINPSITPEEARDTLLASAHPLGSGVGDPDFGHGRLDVAAALERLRPKPPVIAPPPVKPPVPVRPSPVPPQVPPPASGPVVPPTAKPPVLNSPDEPIPLQQSRVVLRQPAPVVQIPNIPAGDFRVSPNPWRADQDGSSPVRFENVPLDSTVKIFTTSGHLVVTLPSTGGAASWDLRNDSGEHVASGLYIYLITPPQGPPFHGRLGVIH